ncbi:efflux RND transporter periplasmic adaptor subunit [Stutzerimonas chloritidismutans]|uniref:efflux RND transporter periplasmic adaptor subunit n=1 Tax=Stutzerimonas chloritidismutans TaxID=203192 RepID=UPI003F14B0A0
MHNRSKAIWILGALVLTGAAGRWLLAEPETATPAKPRAVPVRVVTVERKDVEDFAIGIGRVASMQSVVIRTQIDGVLTRLHVDEGQWVKAGDLLATIDDRSARASLQQAKAQLDQSQAQLTGAEIDLKRYRELVAEKGVSRQTFDQQEALVNQLRATLAGNKAAIVAAEVQLSHTRILSPVTGRVGIRSVDEGNFLRASDADGLFSVTQIAPISVEFSLPQVMLPTLQRLLEVPEAAPVSAYLTGEGSDDVLLAEGRLRLIDNQVSASTGTLRVKAEFANDDHALWPGQLVNVRVRTGQFPAALTVPPRAVSRGLEGHFVYRLDGNVAELQPVTVKHQSERLFIVEGVSAGDRLVSDGQSRLKPGVEVEVLEGQHADPAMVTQAQP